MEHEYDYLIIGAGMTADAAVAALHEADPQAHIGVLGEEPQNPYARPPLSKGLWKEDKPPSEVVDLGTPGKGVKVFTGRRAVSLDTTERRVEDDQGDGWSYRRLLLATGAGPRRLSLPAHERIIHFRTLADFEALHRLATPGAQVLVVGSGFIGSEVAAALTGAGCKVTMVFPQTRIGAGRFPDSLAEFVTGYYRDKGVEMRTGVTVTGGSADDSGVTLELSDGSQLRGAVVVAGLGVTPNVELARQAGLEVDNGIVVNGLLRTSEPDVWAAGDVANFPCPALGRRLRVEHENAAQDMGALAGRNMAGGDEAYDTLPFFYSDLFDLGYEAVGLLDNRLEVVEDWTTPFREGVVYYLDGGRVRGVLLWNVWDQVDKARELIAHAGAVDAASLRGRIHG